MTKQKTTTLSNLEHQERHAQLHKSFDELVADFIDQTGKLPTKTSIYELMVWSHEQTIKPSVKFAQKKA